MTRISPPTPEQLAIIEQQLGRKPRGIIGVAAATDAGIPLSLKMQPLVEDKPFPTLYWLCSKDIYQAIAALETAGLVKTLEARIEQDEALKSGHLADQARYRDLRWAATTDAQRARISELGFTELFNNYGIGGIAQWDKIRCLHMQYAYHLAEGSTLGRLLDQEYGLSEISPAL
ncbi:MAG: DUF501 domain-containing protein [Pontibacterium sp.]